MSFCHYMYVVLRVAGCDVAAMMVRFSWWASRWSPCMDLMKVHKEVRDQGSEINMAADTLLQGGPPSQEEREDTQTSTPRKRGL